MTTKILRSLLSELRQAAPQKNIKDNLAAQYILAQFKKFQTKDEQLCKARNEVQFLGQIYLTYLSSLRKHDELHKEYHGRS